MRWTLVVSQDEAFQREAIARIGGDQPIVGATGEASAVNLVRAVEVERILVDALDEVGKHFLGLLSALPARRFPRVVVVDPVQRRSRYETSPTLARALEAETRQPA